MTRNLILSAKTAADIDRRIDRVLKGLGNPEPPLRLEDVRELLKLDVRFYRANDPNATQEIVSRIRVGTIQVFKRPQLLFEAIRKMSLKALYLPDSKRIMLDSSLPPLKHRWNEAHEVGHSLLPWHESVMHGDTQHTLSQACHEQIEAEANFAAGELLFLRDRFSDDMHSLPANFDSIRQLKERYGNTLSTTLYHFVDGVADGRAIVGMISCHPHLSRRPSDFDPRHPCKHFVGSAEFQRRFGQLGEIEIFRAMASYCGSQSGGLLGVSQITLPDSNGNAHRFHFETFFNRYDALTLGVDEGPVNTTIFQG